MSYVRYVMMVVIDPKLELVVGLTKKKGPKHLLERITFPGGKLEGDETAQAAATREMAEETGVRVPEDAWSTLLIRGDDSYSLHVLVATSDEVQFARQMETEPVWRLEYAKHLELAKLQPEKYVSDFVEVLEKALKQAVVARPASV